MGADEKERKLKLEFRFFTIRCVTENYEKNRKKIQTIKR